MRCLASRIFRGRKFCQGKAIWLIWNHGYFLLVRFCFASNLHTNTVLFNFLTVFSFTFCGLGVWHHIASCVCVIVSNTINFRPPFSIVIQDDACSQYVFFFFSGNTPILSNIFHLINYTNYQMETNETSPTYPKNQSKIFPMFYINFNNLHNTFSS